MRADRLLALMMLLQTRGKMTTSRLAEELDVSRRTILRDIDSLSFAGVPIYAEGGHGGGVALDENYRTTLTGLQDAEIHSLFLADNAALLKEIGLGEASERTLLKLFAALPRPQQPSVDHMRQRIHIDPLWWWYDSQPLPFWDELQRAVYEDRPIQAIYENYSGEKVERVLEPYSLVAKNSLWYVIAKRDGEFRTYRASRFHAITVLETHFRRDADFDLPTYWQEHVQDFVTTISEYDFTLQIHGSRISFARWLTTGRYEIVTPEDDEGWLTVQFHLESKDLALMLVFGLGEQCEIIEPPELQQAVLQTAHTILNNYDAKIHKQH